LKGEGGMGLFFIFYYLVSVLLHFLNYYWRGNGAWVCFSFFVIFFYLEVFCGGRGAWVFLFFGKKLELGRVWAQN
jgi:hypothetical protein